jgi:hypothetical protein
MEGQEPEAVPAADEAAAEDDEHTHEGSFATGQEAVEHHPERLDMEGDFAEGEEAHKPVHEGSFAEGQEDIEHHPELRENEGDFASGQEEEHPHPAQ